jgi:hypothetical protein
MKMKDQVVRFRSSLFSSSDFSHMAHNATTLRDHNS